MKKFTGTTRYNLKRKVVSLRTRKLMSWVDIAAAISTEEITVTPRMANRLFQEARGKGQQADHLPGKGGRWPSEWDTAAEVPYLAGDGSHNDWDRVERPED